MSERGPEIRYQLAEGCFDDFLDTLCLDQPQQDDPHINHIVFAAAQYLKVIGVEKVQHEQATGEWDEPVQVALWKTLKEVVPTQIVPVSLGLVVAQALFNPNSVLGRSHKTQLLAKSVAAANHAFDNVGRGDPYYFAEVITESAILYDIPGAREVFQQDLKDALCNPDNRPNDTGEHWRRIAEVIQ